jgi:ubiquinol-cytochrome c reductase cytochrome c subunit
MLIRTVRLIPLAAALFSVLPLAAQAPAGDAAKGKQLFVSYGCYQCHGRQAQGGAAGVRLAPHPIPLKALIAYVRHPTGQMPPVTAKVVTDAELADIHAFLKTIPEPKPVKDIPLLNP